MNITDIYLAITKHTEKGRQQATVSSLQQLSAQRGTHRCTCYCGQPWFGTRPPPRCCPRVCIMTRQARPAPCGHDR